ncbi:MAG: OFA family MFS transporter [Nitriliruptoraceae bacterium]
MPGSSPGPAPAPALRPTSVPRRAWVVLVAGLLSNFSIGILYTWSNLRDVLQAYEEWSVGQLTVPFSIGGLVFASTLIVAGSLQDRFGPRPVMLAGVAMVGGGTMLSALVTRSPALFFLTFGVLIGAGIGFVYACPRQAAMKWFDPSRRGMVNGVVVAGFGLGSLWIGPVQLFMLDELGWSLERTLVGVGLLILVVGFLCSALVVDPPAGYVPPDPPQRRTARQSVAHQLAPSVSLRTTLRTPQAYLIVVIFALVSSAGAFVLASVTDVLRVQSDGGDPAQVMMLIGAAVPALAVANGVGRVVGGIGSDRLGRIAALHLIHVGSFVNMFLLQFWTSPWVLFVACLIAAALFGAVLAVIPSLVADYFGLQAYGANYGFIFLGWGLSLVIGPTIGSVVLEATGAYVGTYYAAMGLLAVSAYLVVRLEPPRFDPIQIIDPVYKREVLGMSEERIAAEAALARSGPDGRARP